MSKAHQNNTNDAYNSEIAKCPANYQPLTPISFLQRAAEVFPEHIAIIHGNKKIKYQTFYQRCKQLASALKNQGIEKGDTVSVMLANTPPMLEAHYGIPMTKAVLHSINTRLDAGVIAYQLDHAQSRVLIVDKEFSEVIKKALELTTIKPLVIHYHDEEFPQKGECIGQFDYEEFLQHGERHYAWSMPDDEWDAISINYTSGTTGKPKGVVYHHRGAYLLAQGNALTAAIPKHAVYLWTLPMFHCNGWCFPWTISALTGTHVCLRQVIGNQIWRAVKRHKVTHLCGAPVVMSIILSSKAELSEEETNVNRNIEFMTAAAPPPGSVLRSMKDAGFNVTHLYGLTEVYGPAVINDWHVNWNDLDADKQAELKLRQGVKYHSLEGLDVLDPETMAPIKQDGKSIGEVMFKGNIVMKGYLKNEAETAKAFQGGWFHSGDLAVIYPDGYVQLKDRSKDIIISGGENISSIEIEEALYKHPAVEVAAVVAMQDHKWGEVPCAFIELKAGKNTDETELRDWCYQHLARFKVPKKFIFETIDKTSTGKIQKFNLRQRIAEILSNENE